ncbi:MAG: hypothetical protein Q9182_006897 [Xanthomendoza sp. 2 TL-2023]
MKRKREDEVGKTSARPRPTQHSKNGRRELESKKLAESINLTIGKMNSRLLADLIAQRTRNFGQDLSLVELQDLHVPESAILDTSEWDQERLAQNLPEFLVHFAQDGGMSPDLSLAPKMPGSPHTVVITSAALRAAELSRKLTVIRVLRRFQTEDATVAKLFAKHIKLKDATVFVQKTRINIGIGTPSRMIDLLTERQFKALKIDDLDRVIIDCSFVDQKKRSIFDMKETQRPLIQLLNRHELKARYADIASPVKLLFY